MPSLFDWIDDLSKPPDDPTLKAIDQWKQIDESLKHGDYISKINFEDSPLAHIENAVKAINEKLEIEHQARLESEKNAKKQASVDKNRFVFNTVVGIVSAVSAVVGAVFAALSFFS